MLKVFRKNTKTIVWIVVISFVLWGGYAVSSQFEKRGRYAGEIFGKPVSFQEFDIYYRSVQLFSFGGSKTSEDPEVLRQQAWQSLILSTAAKREKINVTDEEVRAEIFRLMAIQKIDAPTEAIYQRWLQATARETPKVFEHQIRELLRTQKLVQKINSEPVSSPSEQDLKKMFLGEEQKLSFEMIPFKTLEEAKNFAAKVKDEKSWKKESADMSVKPATTPLISMDSLIQQWGIPETQMQTLWTLTAGKISEPIAVAGQFAVFYITKKQAADEKKFNEDMKKTLTQRFAEKQRYERFSLWSQKVFMEARLKDYQETSKP